MKNVVKYIVLVFTVGIYLTFLNTDLILDNVDVTAFYNSKIYIVVLLVLIVVYVILVSISFLNSVLLTKKEERSRQVRLLDKINEIDPNFDEYQFINTVFEKYKEIQEACSNYDLKTINKNVTNQVYDEYVTELEKLKRKNRIFKASDIRLDLGKLLDISKYHNVIKTRVYLSVSSCNSIIDSRTNKVIKGGKFRVYTSYMFNFIKIIDECPNCGADTKDDQDVCSKCGNKIIKTNHNWIIAKREIINKGKE